MAATLDRSGIQPPREGCLDPVITVDILEQIIEEKSGSHANQNQKVPSGRCANIDAISMALFCIEYSLQNTTEPVGAGLLAKAA
ncbi:hypothetical protein [Pseudomonas frederiksbergensis]|jgi:hypothetical protein|uniref:Uncharacterized protein n=1 Tax=Pseudomonas frederiksbergensis TaxID=104087 RepID=A0A423J679_9PSED|nr:hypothetical protein [Pseudomonas frederiksbergensis]RON33223.1 hypothetical protein BK661_12565 [Pseudomonas frederiksbergensis]